MSVVFVLSGVPVSEVLWRSDDRRSVVVFWTFLASTIVALRRSYLRGERELRQRQGRCPRCDYDLRATPGRCPECGAAGSVSVGG